MRDQRAEALARILVHYSAGVKEGDVCVIEGETAAEPLALAVYEEVLQVGGLPIVELMMEGQAPAFFKLASDEQLDWVSPTDSVGRRGRGRAHSRSWPTRTRARCPASIPRARHAGSGRRSR